MREILARQGSSVISLEKGKRDRELFLDGMTRGLEYRRVPESEQSVRRIVVVVERTNNSTSRNSSIGLLNCSESIVYHGPPKWSGRKTRRQGRKLKVSKSYVKLLLLLPYRVVVQHHEGLLELELERMKWSRLANKNKRRAQKRESRLGDKTTVTAHESASLVSQSASRETGLETAKKGIRYPLRSSLLFPSSEKADIQSGDTLFGRNLERPRRDEDIV